MHVFNFSTVETVVVLIYMRPNHILKDLIRHVYTELNRGSDYCYGRAIGDLVLNCARKVELLKNRSRGNFC